MRPTCDCGGEIVPYKVDHFPVRLSACLKCQKQHGPWPDVVKRTSPPYTPTLGQMWKLNVREKTVRQRLDALLVELPEWKTTCPECGAPMVHTRLQGYVCARCR